METTEKIKVFIKIKDGKTVCICSRGHRLCAEECEKAVVKRDKYTGWLETMKQDRYGHCKCIDNEK